MMKSGLFKILALSCAAAIMMLLAACGEKAPSPDAPNISKEDISQTQNITPEADSKDTDEELRYNVTEVKLLCQNWTHTFENLSFDKAVSLSNSQINTFLDKLLALEFVEEDTVKPYDELCVKTMIVSGEDEYYVYFCRGRILLAPSADAGYDELKAYNFKGDPIFDYIYNLHNEIKPAGTNAIWRPDHNADTDSDEEQTPDEELRYNVKEVLFYSYFWEHTRPDITFQEDAVQLSNAQINGLLDKLSALDFSEANGEPVLGGTPVVCTIVTDDEKYCLDFNSGIITLWQSEEELYTLEGRKHWKIYNFSGDPIFDYVRELHNAVKPDGIEPIF